MTDTATFYKYLELSKQRKLNGKAFGELCQYCGNGEHEMSLTEARTCTTCGAEMRKPLAIFLGIPIYDASDLVELQSDKYSCNYLFPSFS